MIYRNSYFKKELRQAYIENKISTKKKVEFGVFLGLISIALHFVLQTLTKSVLSDTAPYIMQASYFSTVYIYINVAFYIYILYFIIYYDYLSFAEIRKNRWYLLVKMGYKPLTMILSKLVALCYSLIFVYTLGFTVTIIMTAFLKYHFVYKYLPALYVAGLVDLSVIGTILTTASLYIKKKSTARYLAVLFFGIIIMLRNVLGYHDVIADRILMQNFFVLFDFGRSMYLPICVLIVFLCLVICFFKAKDVAKYYSLPYNTHEYVLPENTVILKRDYITGKIRQLYDIDKIKLRSKMFDFLINAILICIVFAAVIFNIFVILISTSQQGKEVTIRGVIPYVFMSSTMAPTIVENDLAYFRKVDKSIGIDIGEIVIFKEDNVVFVERIIDKDGDLYTVDIDSYPPMSKENTMLKTIDRAVIYGVFTGKNRWLGALILFANTIFGRISFLLVPVMLMFFYKQVKNFFAKSSHMSDDE